MYRGEIETKGRKWQSLLPFRTHTCFAYEKKVIPIVNNSTYKENIELVENVDTGHDVVANATCLCGMSSMKIQRTNRESVQTPKVLLFLFPLRLPIHLRCIFPLSVTSLLSNGEASNAQIVCNLPNHKGAKSRIRNNIHQ
jgi:hypothetical protein